MNLRTNYRVASPGAFKAMMAMEQYISGQFENKVLYELLKIRVSQINGLRLLSRYACQRPDETGRLCGSYFIAECVA